MNSYLQSSGCPCGKEHTASVEEVLIGSGVIEKVPQLIAKYGAKKPFLLADGNTWDAAGEKLSQILKAQGICYSAYKFSRQRLMPEEKAVGSAVMHYDSSCDLIIGIGSGVINDIGKILSCTAGKPYFIVATAPSMDGYASATSAMEMDGVKVTLNTRCPDVIVGDTDILRLAPEHMLKAGIGDMLAKYVAITEWRIGQVITGEYYCEEVAQLVRGALKKCTDNAEGLLKREPEAVEAVFEGLIISGLAMAYAGASRPASGTEHYFSHIWDMRALEFGTKSDLHGIQCAMGTLYAVKLYEKLKQLQPDQKKAQAYVQNFDYDAWSGQMKAFLGASVDTLIALETKEGKYRKDTHPARYARIENNWQQILQIIEQELPSLSQTEQLMDTLQISKDSETLGVDRACLRQTFQTTKDIRDKYVLARLAWDMGVLEELCEVL